MPVPQLVKPALIGCVLFKDKLPNNKDRRHELEGFHSEGGKEVTNNTSD